MIHYYSIRSVVGKLFFIFRKSLHSVQGYFQEPSSGLLTVIDHRTGRDYTIPIDHNAVRAIHFQAICAGNEPTTLNRVKNGLRVLDPGFQNTAVMESAVTFV